MKEKHLNALLLKAFPEPPPRFSEKVRVRAEASAACVAASRLEAEYRVVGFQPMTLQAFVEGLACRAGVPLDNVLAHAGVSDLGDVTSPGIPDLCRQIGLPLREALSLCRHSLALLTGAGGDALQPALARGRRIPDLLTRSEQALGDVEATYDAMQTRLLRAMTSEFERVYHERP